MYWDDYDEKLLPQYYDSSNITPRPSYPELLYFNGYIKNKNIFRCPAWAVGQDRRNYEWPHRGATGAGYYTGTSGSNATFLFVFDYVYNGEWPGNDKNRNVRNVKNPSQIICMTEGPMTTNDGLNGFQYTYASYGRVTTGYYGQNHLYPLHFNGYNYLFYDGHVEWMSIIQAKDIKYWIP